VLNVCVAVSGKAANELKVVRALQEFSSFSSAWKIQMSGHYLEKKQCFCNEQTYLAVCSVQG